MTRWWRRTTFQLEDRARRMFLWLGAHDAEFFLAVFVVAVVLTICEWRR